MDLIIKGKRAPLFSKRLLGKPRLPEVPGDQAAEGQGVRAPDGRFSPRAPRFRVYRGGGGGFRAVRGLGV